MLMGLKIVGDLSNKNYSKILSNMHRKIGIIRRVIKDDSADVIPCVCGGMVTCKVCSGHGVLRGKNCYYIYYNDLDKAQVNDIANFIKVLPTNVEYETKLVFKEVGKPRLKQDLIIGKEILVTGSAAVGCGVKGEKLAGMERFDKRTKRRKYVIFTNAMLIVRYVQKRNLTTYYEFGDGTIEYVWKDKKDPYGITSMSVLAYRFSSIDTYIPVNSYKVTYPEEAVMHAIKRANGETDEYFVANYKKDDYMQNYEEEMNGRSGELEEEEEILEEEEEKR